MNIRLLVCLALLAICASPTIGIGDLLPSIWDLIRSSLGIYIRQKLVTFFKFADVNRNDKVEQADFDYIVVRIAELYPEVDPAKIEYFHNVVVPKAWRAFRKMFPRAEPEPITLVDLLLLFVNAPNLLLNAKTFSDSVFNVCDLNGDDIVNITETTSLYRARNLSSITGEIAFHEADLNKNGNLTKEELILCFIEFFQAPDENVDWCKDIAGPLVPRKEADGGIV